MGPKPFTIGSPPADPETSYAEMLKVTISEDACVWTGSYNITHTATKSLENAVVLHCPKIAEAFYGEWAQIALLSEPLDWNNDWCTPQWTFDRNIPSQTVLMVFLQGKWYKINVFQTNERKPRVFR